MEGTLDAVKLPELYFVEYVFLFLVLFSLFLGSNFQLTPYNMGNWCCGDIQCNALHQLSLTMLL